MDDAAFLEMFGANVKRCRQGLGLTQQELALRVDSRSANESLDKRTISRIELGKQNVSLKLLNKLAKALGVEASQLLIKP